MPELKLTLESASVLPGESLRGRVSWQCSKTPRKLVLGLRWRTESQGTPETGLIGELHLPYESASGETDFEIEVPWLAPPTYRGRLLSILWRLELRADLDSWINPEIVEDIEIRGARFPEKLLSEAAGTE